MSQILPKKRDTSRSISNRVLSKRIPSGTSTSGIAGTTVNGSRHISNGSRIVSLTRRAVNPDDSFSEEAIHFNENKHTILSNFEEWIKLLTDNKITSKNSWQFQLIDYFHDMNVIKDGESINFQRASATLDGCVKIYLSRVESAATETGKLLSGLAKKDTTEVQEENEEVENEEGSEEKTKRKYNRVVESTLVDFDSITMKKLEQELAIDPLFKKALAEFDEGGAKSLLLNTLSIDNSGRVIFDATNAIKESEVTESDDEDENNESANNTMTIVDPAPIEFGELENMLFKDDDLSGTTLCPSLKELQSAFDDISKASAILSDFNKNNMTVKDEEEEEVVPEPEFEDFGEDFGDFDDNKDDAIDNMHQSVVQKVFSEPEQYIQSTVSTEIMDRDLMAYFDETITANWRGPEHWKVTALKKSKKLDGVPKETTPGVEPVKRKKNVQTVVDFFGPDEDEDSIFEPPNRGPLTITYKRNDNDASAHKLPDDIKYNSLRLTNLFTKPGVTILYFPQRSIDEPNTGTLTDEQFFAEQYNKQVEEEEEQSRLAALFHQAEYDDFGGDDDFGGIDFNDALKTDTALNAMDEEDIKENIVNETTLLGRRRPEYVNFSRVAKRVDVKLLKDNLWNSIKEEKETKSFSDIVGKIGEVYPTEQRKDLSTSFCFICLLHLANEHGLEIEPRKENADLDIKFSDVPIEG